MMHETISIDEAFRDARRGLEAMARASDRHALTMANRAAAVCYSHLAARWYLVRVDGGLGVCPLLDAEGKPVKGDDGRTVTVNDNRESVVVDSLREAGIDAYCPRDIRTKRSPRKKSGVKFSVPMFPGYAFVRIPATGAAMLGVLSFDGVRGFVCHRDGPVVVPDKLVHEVKVYEALKPKERRLISSLANLGDRMVIRSGALNGYVGEVVFVDGRRGMVDLELTLFGRATRVTLGLDGVKKSV